MLGRAVGGVACFALIVAGAAFANPRPDAQRVRSVYLSLGADRKVEQSGALLATTLVLLRPEWVFVETDGSYLPSGSGSAADVYVAVDGAKLSNDSMLDWRGSLSPHEHSFDAVGAAWLGTGRHVVTLMASPIDASASSFTVRAGANLSVLVHPAARVAAFSLREQSATFGFRTGGITTMPLRFLTRHSFRRRQVVREM